MVTQQEFINALLEPLPAAMAPLALADAPGAVVRGKLSGQSLSEAFGSVMADPTSLEGRVYGEDITGDTGSGFILELLTDPTALAGLGTAGLGMALSRRAFLKQAGRAAAVAGLPDSILAKGAKLAKSASDPSIVKKARRYNELSENILEGMDFEGEIDWIYHTVKNPQKREAAIRRLAEDNHEINALKEMSKLEEELWDAGVSPEALSADGEFRLYQIEEGVVLPGGGDIRIGDKETLDKHLKWDTESTRAGVYGAREEVIVNRRLMKEKASKKLEKKARKRIRKGDYSLMPPGRGPRPGPPDIRPADYILLERLIREMSQQAPGGRYGY